MTKTTFPLDQLIGVDMIGPATLEEEVQFPALEELPLEKGVSSEYSLVPVEQEEDALDHSYGDLAYLCMQAQEEDGYKEKLLEKLVPLLKDHDFVDKKTHWSRVRDSFVDYLFLDRLRYGMDGTYGFIIPLEQKKQFEDKLKVVQDIPEWPKHSGEGYFLSSFLLGSVAFGSYPVFHPESLSETFFAVFNPWPEGVIWTAIGSVSGAALWYAVEKVKHIPARRKYRQSAEAVNSLLGTYDDCKNEKQPYEYSIIKHFLDITPDIAKKK